MDVTRLMDEYEKKQVVDVRYANEWDAGHIEGSIHIPVDELDDRSGELDRSRPVVTVCRSGSRSAAAANALSDEGINAESLDGGVLAWAKAGLPLTATDGQPGTVAEPEPPADDRPEAHRRLQSDFMNLIFEVQEHFGDHEPSEEEIQGYLRDRLIQEGHSPEEADETMARVVAAGAADPG